MARWKQLSPEEQNLLLGEITKTLVAALPDGWRQLTLDYRVIGRKSSVATSVLGADGTARRWRPPRDVWPLFADLRTGMYAEDQGTWFSLRLTIEHPDTFSVKYNWKNEPNFKGEYPSPEEFAVDQHRFPRADENMPEWFRQKLAAAPQNGATPPADG
jgi:hypothetical protein